MKMKIKINLKMKNELLKLMNNKDNGNELKNKLGILLKDNINFGSTYIALYISFITYKSYFFTI